MRRTGTTRRGALTAAGALAAGGLLTGCDGGARPAAERPGSARAVRTTPEQRLRTASVRTSAALLARYDEVAAAHPATAAGLAPLRIAVRQHTEALAEGAAPAPTSPAPTASASPSATTEAVRDPGDPRATPSGDARGALKELAAEARRACDAHTASLLEAEPELSRLLASVAAACGVHAYLLTELAKETPAS
ncbi:hypothetical protein OG233_07775 [Streptomyces sp. NBC_01218]|uniref:hypothetical protein n=1 Tax=Streptomyces sp. NBC_01218 TaxID=2903780 RepID=UPI002E12B35B|nr:hypothetical protein OG233_07775 [Streptomyces sp. NBC_01218]